MGMIIIYQDRDEITAAEILLNLDHESRFQFEYYVFSPAKGDISGDHEWLENIGMSPRKSAKLRR